MSGSFLDCTASPDKGIVDGAEPTVVDTPRKGLTARQQVFLELVQTESNYVNILHTIMTVSNFYIKKYFLEKVVWMDQSQLNFFNNNLIFIKNMFFSIIVSAIYTIISKSKSCHFSLAKNNICIKKAVPLGVILS